jgi:hypothetical protein
MTILGTSFEQLGLEPNATMLSKDNIVRYVRATSKPIGIVDIRERERGAVFVKPEAFYDAVTILVYLPNGLIGALMDPNGELAVRIENLPPSLKGAWDGATVVKKQKFRIQMGEPVPLVATAPKKRLYRVPRGNVAENVEPMEKPKPKPKYRVPGFAKPSKPKPKYKVPMGANVEPSDVKPPVKKKFSVPMEPVAKSKEPVAESKKPMAEQPSKKKFSIPMEPVAKSKTPMEEEKLEPAGAANPPKKRFDISKVQQAAAPSKQVVSILKKGPKKETEESRSAAATAAARRDTVRRIRFANELGKNLAQAKPFGRLNVINQTRRKVRNNNSNNNNNNNNNSIQFSNNSNSNNNNITYNSNNLSESNFD